MKVFQIYFNESQRSYLEPAHFMPFFNYDPSLFLESGVIKDLIDKGHHRDSDYFGVVGYKLREKIGIMTNNWRGHPNIANHSTQEFTPEEFKKQLYQYKPDVMSFQCHAPHDTVMVANQFHPRFAEFWIKIMKQIGYDWEPGDNQNVFYCNYFVARSEIYEKYVAEMLAPAMAVMKYMPELKIDSGYWNSPWPKELHRKFGINHWPYHPFICERMFTYFAEIHNLKCLHY